MRYLIGQRWRCASNRYGAFDFVIIAPGSKPDRKRCRLEYLDPSSRSHGNEAEYTHKHLKRYGVLVESK